MSEQHARYQGLHFWMQSIVFASLAALLLVTFVGQRIEVQMWSMTPTLLEGDSMVVRRVLYTPARGDIIVFVRHDFEDGAALAKRVVALGGDVVDINTDTGLVYVNGAALDEPYVYEPTHRAGDILYPYTVPEGHIFVLGDNRNNSMDSRHTEIGAVDEREIIGQVVAVMLPFHRIGLF